MGDGFVHRSLTSYDGTVIAYQVRPTKLPPARTIVLANGLGCNWATWRHLTNRLPDCKIITWDYRGLFGSGPPEDGALDLRAHALDLLEVLHTEKVDTAVFIGWSMGVQVVLEHLRTNMETAQAVVLLNGGWGRAFDHMLFGKLIGPLVPHALALAEYAAPAVSLGMRSAVSWSKFIPLLKFSGFVAETLDEEVFSDLAADYASMDFKMYTRILAQVGGHDARDVLPRITVPTLVISSERDVFTPLPVATEMAQSIPGARFMIVPNCTHYAEVEKPDLVNSAIIDFLASITPAQSRQQAAVLAASA
jgi:pimeloyl-ACP methyl ester carboxylesterase